MFALGLSLLLMTIPPGDLWCDLRTRFFESATGHFGFVADSFSAV
jgi:hypothetical protein